MMEHIELREKIPLLDLPWVGGKPWTLVDLWGMQHQQSVQRAHNHSK
jgi:hypothetical protein